MATTYTPAEGTYPGRPPCSSCGSDFHLHRSLAMGARATGPELVALYQGGTPLWCPERYRPATLDDAQAELAQAEASGDQARVFVARGNLQQLVRAEAREVGGLRGSYLATGNAPCPGCDRIMSHREAAEQGECNDCHGLTADERHELTLTAEPPTPWRGDPSDHWPVDHAEGE